MLGLGQFGLVLGELALGVVSLLFAALRLRLPRCTQAHLVGGTLPRVARQDSYGCTRYGAAGLQRAQGGEWHCYLLHG